MDEIRVIITQWTQYLDTIDISDSGEISITFRNDVARASEMVSTLIEQRQDLAELYPTDFEDLRRLETRQEQLLDLVRAQNTQLCASIYSKVEEAASEIRLVTILPGEREDDIQCDMKVASLQDNCPEFRALSYTWGSPLSPQVEIILNGKRFPVSTNLASAIRCQLRSKNQPVTYWIDAISINQASPEERSSQVRYMSTIYFKAVEIVSWLGDEEEGSADGMVLISDLGQKLSEDPDLLKMILEGSRRGSKTFRDIVNSDLAQSLATTFTTNPTAWHSVCTITNRSYWERAWVMQETALTENLRIACGQHALSWDSFRNALMLLLQVAYQLILQNTGVINERSEGGWAMVHDIRGHVRTDDIVTLSQTMLTLRQSQSTDPRDKIFAFLGLQNNTNFPVDYVKPVQALYREVMKVLIEEKMCLDILTACHMNHGIPNLPSWVPDWSITDIGRKNILPLEAFSTNPTKYPAYASSGPSSPFIQFSADLHKITVAGIFLDRITETSSSGATDEFFDSAFALWKKFTSTIDQEPDAQKKEWKTEYADNFWRTLIMDRPSPTNVPLRYRIHASQAANYKAQFEIRFEIVPISSLGPPSNPNFTDLQRTLEFCSDYIFATNVAGEGRRVAVTEKGYFALIPAEAQVGDLICVFLGAQVPFVLRAMGEEEEFQLVGDCFVQGFMDGEIMDEVKEGASAVRDFVLV